VKTVLVWVAAVGGGGAVLVETAVIDIGLERLEFRGVDMVWRGEGMTVKSHPEMTR